MTKSQKITLSASRDIPFDRLKSASTEIRAVARTDPTAAAEGVIALAQRIWPAFEHIDTSSGALGNAAS